MALAGVFLAIWTAAGMLIPMRLKVHQLWHEWGRGEKSSIYRFFSDNPTALQGFRSFDDMEAQIRASYERYDAKEASVATHPESQQSSVQKELASAQSEIEDVLARSDAVIRTANQVYLDNHFRVSLRRILFAAVLGALGIGLFAWAANPSSVVTAHPSLSSVDLSGADLTGANLQGVEMRNSNLTGANLTGADLEGADLAGASLERVVWSKTICPDGKVSDDVGRTCVNHLNI